MRTSRITAIFVTLLLSALAFAVPRPLATITWTGAADNNWTNGANWAGGIAPGAIDTATFNATSNLCTINASVTVQGILIDVGYTGTVTQAAGVNVTLGVDGFVQNAATFNGSSGRLAVAGPFTHSGGIFIPGTGPVVINGAANNALTVSAGTAFNDLYINDGLVGYWKFDEAAGPALDSSGYGHTGTYVNTPVGDADVPAVGFTNPRSLRFDEVDGDVVQVTRTPILEMDGPFTVMCWAKRNGAAFEATRWAAMFRKSYNFNQGPHGDYSLQIPQGAYNTVAFGTGHAGDVVDDLYSSPGSIPDLTWVHIAGIYDPTGPPPQKRLYINGVLNASKTWTSAIVHDTNSPSGDLYIGQAGTNPGLEFFNGWLDEIRLYSRALTDQEIQAISIGNQPAIAGSVRTLAGGALDVNGDLVLNAGTFDSAGQNLRVAGSWFNHGSLFLSATGSVTLDGAAGGEALLSGGQGFNNLSVNGAGGWALSDRLRVSGTLSIAAGTLDVSARNYVVHAGTVTQTGGTFTPQAGTVVLDSTTNRTFNFTTPVNNLRIEDPTEGGLVGYWKFDEGQRPTSRDSAGANIATLVNLAPLTATRPTRSVPFWSTVPAPLPFDNAHSLSLDGVDDYVTAGVAGLPTIQAAKSIALWFRYPTLPASTRDLISMWDQPLPGAALVVGFRDSGAGMAFEVWGWTARYLTAPLPTANVWHHAAYTWDGTTHRLFIDGSQVATDAVTPVNTGTPTIMTFGCWPWNGSVPIEFFEGNLDDLRIYNTAITPGQVANLAGGRYADGRAMTAIFSAGSALTVNGTFAIDSGIYNANGNTTTLLSLFTLASGNGRYEGSSALQTFNAGLTVTGSTLLGAAGNVDVNGNFALGGGDFTASSTITTVSGHFTVTGTPTFTHNSGLVTLDGAANQNLTTGAIPFNNLTVNKTGAAGTDTVIVSGALNVAGILRVTDGVLAQGADNLTADSIVVETNGAWTNLSTGDVTVGAGGVSNSGSINLDSSGGGCGDPDLILLRSTVNGVQRPWIGGGIFIMNDLAVQDQGGTAPIWVYSGTVGTGVGGNWDIQAACRVPGFTVNPTSGLITTEAGGQDVFTIVLTGQPTSNVLVGISSSDTTEGTVAPASFTFTPVNWNVARTVTVTGVDDLIADGPVPYLVVNAAGVSADSAYNGLDPADVVVINLDDEVASVQVTPTSGLLTSEGGGTEAFTVVLTSQPTANVVIGISSSDTTEGTVSAAALTFTTVTWGAPQMVTVSGVDDALLDGNIAYTIVTAPAASADPGYAGFNPADVRVTNIDNDGPGITVSPTTGLFTTESGGTATFRVVLNQPPVADVTIGISSSDTTEGSVSAAALTFTAVTWSVPQRVTVTGVQDGLLDGNIAYTLLTAAAASGDVNYAGFDADDVAAVNLDDDAAGISVIPTSGLITTEAGGSDTFLVALNFAPTSNVVIGLSSSDTSEGTVSPASLTFTTTNWNTARTVVVTGVDDAAVDGNAAYSIVTAQAASADAGYGVINPPDVAAVNLDNDVIGIEVDEPGFCFLSAAGPGGGLPVALLALLMGALLLTRRRARPAWCALLLALATVPAFAADDPDLPSVDILPALLEGAPLEQERRPQDRRTPVPRRAARTPLVDFANWEWQVLAGLALYSGDFDADAEMVAGLHVHVPTPGLLKYSGVFAEVLYSSMDRDDPTLRVSQDEIFFVGMGADYEFVTFETTRASAQLGLLYSDFGDISHTQEGFSLLGGVTGRLRASKWLWLNATAQLAYAPETKDWVTFLFAGVEIRY